MLFSASLIHRIEFAPQRELYFLALYRILEAGLIAALVFSPVSILVDPESDPYLGTAVAVGYLLLATILLVWGRNERWFTPLVFGSTVADILAATLAIHALPKASAGIAMMLLFNVAAAAILLRLRFSMILAWIAGVAMLVEYIWTVLSEGDSSRSLAELVMFFTSYTAVAYMCHQAAQRARYSQALAEKRRAQIVNLAEINELIIRRMRTGVLVVDAANRIGLSNETAAALLGYDRQLVESDYDLATVAPELTMRLKCWRIGRHYEDTPLRLAPDQPEVQPRFVSLLADSGLTLIFLDDVSVVSRRAESLTLLALGRFSASLAHEIRNPLAAIKHASQLLEESSNLDKGDQRLLDIILKQCQRTNGIVESVLGLARRERANPENLDLVGFVSRFVDEYRQTLSSEYDNLEIQTLHSTVQALVDPRHLYQILAVLTHNALRYGRFPDTPAQVRIEVVYTGGSVGINVLDQGPGIPDAAVLQLFQPFFTTSDHGTGLGLYIARELCNANQSNLEYVAIPGSGACFRITLPGPYALIPN
ncbi:two-component sensor histidine kinase [Xylella fastidiosa subsp. pauca]|uniref:sensor histidine kinase n=1 Tax=Xylella fastidiosa TaxID=2371 RepID=UPI00058248E2|nr:ATP-binding protein [Xylella fastidiosa]ARO69438.1 two-component sensor histidine kinase [Xylella fastidiosa subsp. pauca]AVI21826.1 PAS domain-containing sensor histidine kinase [Xylella fastidiosa]AVI23496.1 PAS domain-containing sensor histidine kinase [Xylella fastidiosa]KIA58839.1 ATPase [Xylella fastidiosa]KXB10836.1 PAS domain-containing sensor histidine kinase [Xylella fastidiosa]